MAQPTPKEVDSVIAAYEGAKDAKAYADTFVVEMQLNSGDDYTMVWTTGGYTNG